MAAASMSDPAVDDAFIAAAPGHAVAPDHGAPPDVDVGGTRVAVGRLLAVLDPDAARLLVGCTSGTVVARMAMHLPAVRTGDDILLAGNDDGWYAVGVLPGGIDAEDVPAALPPQAASWHAPRGSIRVAAGNAVSLGGRRVVVRARRIRVRATECLRRFDAVQRWVRGLLTWGAGRIRVETDAEHELLADRIGKVADGEVTIAGRRVHLN